MNIPEEFKCLATCFYQRSDQEYATTQEWARATVRDFLSAGQRRAVKRFLDELLSGSQTDDNLQQLWRSLDSDYRFNSGAAVRRFLG